MTVSNETDVCLDPPLDQIWEKVLELLSKRLSEPVFRAWIPKIQLVELTTDRAVLAVANSFTKGTITNNSVPEIKTALTEILGREIFVRVDVDPSWVEKAGYTPTIASIAVMPDERGPAPQQSNRGRTAATPSEAAQLSARNTFDSFVVGSGNRFCHSAALAVAAKPGQAYNPLFIHGGVGLGKTHLLHAIGNKILSDAPHMVVRYMSSERFINELISSIRENRMPEFKKRYRQLDVLLMDDIQFIEGKESTQEEFFHTFNALRDAGKQIVLTSDRPPRALSTLEERLRSRFEWGLIADIQSPDYETRLAILQKKAGSENINIPEAALEYIAGAFTSNIRELEGALVRANAYATLSGLELTPQALVEVLQPGQRTSRPALTLENLLDAVAAHYRVEPSELKSADRSKDLAEPRHVAMFLAHEVLSLSFPRIGQGFGNRKHTSVLYACNKVRDRLASDAVLAASIRAIKQSLGV